MRSRILPLLLIGQVLGANAEYLTVEDIYNLRSEKDSDQQEVQYEQEESDTTFLNRIDKNIQQQRQFDWKQTIYSSITFEHNNWRRQNNNDWDSSEKTTSVMGIVAGRINPKTSFSVVGRWDYLEFTRDIVIGEEFDFEQFILAAELKHHNIADSDVSVSYGKQAVAYGRAHKGMPNFYADTTFDAGMYDRVFGATVDYKKDIAGILDQIEFSVFEAGQADLQVSEHKGYATRVTKNISENVVAELSHLELDKDKFDFRDQTTSVIREKRSNLGIYFNDRTKEMWVSAIKLDNYALYPIAEHMVQMGASKKGVFHPKGELVGTVTVVDNMKNEVGIGYKFNFSEDKCVVGAEVRYMDHQDKKEGYTGLKNDASVGMHVKCSLSKLGLGKKRRR